jgi:hypothetical protein
VGGEECSVDGPGEEMDLRVESMSSRVDSVREVTSSAVRPAVGIGGRTIAMSTSVRGEYDELTLDPQRPSFEPCPSIEQRMVVLAYNRNNGYLSVNREMECTLLKR